MDVLKQLGATLTPLTIPPDNLPQFNEGFTYEQGAFFHELVRSGGVARLRMMMMTNLAKATAGFDAYFSAAGGGGGKRGAGTRGAGARCGTGNTNSAGYPGVHVVTSFSEPSTEAAVGSPQGITIYGPPFKESEILFIAKSFQDVAQRHTKKPVLKT